VSGLTGSSFFASRVGNYRRRSGADPVPPQTRRDAVHLNYHAGRAVCQYSTRKILEYSARVYLNRVLCALQRPLPNELLRIVARGERSDRALSEEEGERARSSGHSLGGYFPSVFLLRGPARLGSAEDALGWNYNFRIAIHHSQIVADIEVTKGDPDIFSIRNVAEDWVRVFTDAVGYQRGCYLNVAITSAVCQETSDWRVFGKEITCLVSRRPEAGVYATSIDPGQFRAIVDNRAARMALADFRQAMQQPIGTGFFCYRAIEAMMQSMKEKPDEDENISWPRFRELLRIDRSR
jgi:hypothetical protein